MPTYHFETLDVFTSERFGGNPLAVFPEASGLTDRQMQQLATEFNLSETTFVLPPEQPGHTARVRIFNRSHEMPFAGHPTVGTAFVLARAAPSGTTASSSKCRPASSPYGCRTPAARCKAPKSTRRSPSRSA